MPMESPLSMKSLIHPGEQRVVLEPVSWSTYVDLVENAVERRGLMTYDQGVLEIMSPSFGHESAKGFLGRLLETASEELGLEIASAGSLTMKREDLQRGIEPDECYYVGASSALVRGKKDVDLAVDPPPDLALEVDFSHSSMNKLGIYAALGVRECWRYDGDELVFRSLDPGGAYVKVAISTVIPNLRTVDLMRFLARRNDTGETQLVREFRAWLRTAI